MTELKPCPFCGGKAELHPTHDMDTGEMDGYFVICRNKNCTVWPETDEYLTEAEAIAAWNTRAERTCVMYRYKNVLGYIDEWQCSECGADVSGIADDTQPNYCPNCGAKVVGE